MCRFTVALALLTLAVPGISQASLMITLDSSTVVVTQPTSGLIDADFTGTIGGLLPGYSCCGTITDSLWNSAGDSISGGFPKWTGNFSGILFTVQVDSTDLGLYAYDYSLVNPALVELYQCPNSSGVCDGASVNLAVDVVPCQNPNGAPTACPTPTNVPEPTTLALVGLGLTGIGFMRRRRAA